jgi:RimJ/RimL family protein N-acetyltransferase
MRKTFRAAGFVKEAHYRQAWPDDRGVNHDAVAYAILRHDWSTGQQTPVCWDDESH